MLVTDSKFSSVMDRLQHHKRLIADCETDGLKPFHGNKLVGVSVRGVGPQEKSYYFPFRHAPGANLNFHQKGLLMGLLGERTLTNWNIKFDIHFLRKEGMKMPKKIEDVMIAAHLMNENEDNFKLKDLADKYLGSDSSAEEKKLIELLRSRGFGKGHLGDLPASEVAPYACRDTDITEGLRDFYKPPLKDWSLWNLWLENNRYMRATIAMEHRGMLLDVPLIEQYSSEMEIEMAKRQKIANKSAEYEINLNSSKQVQAWLGLDSTAREILEAILDREEIQDVRALLEWRYFAKANQTYYNAYLEKMVRGILRSDLNHIGTITGRLSSSDPNLQAVPRKTKVYKVKDVFPARKGYWFVSADYSQAELRLGSFWAKEQRMVDLLNAGGDIHQTTCEFLHMPRDSAKRINFGAFYGLGVKALAKKLHCSEQEAAHFLNTWHDGFPNVKPYYRYMQNLAEHHGYIRLWSGRVRHFNRDWTYTNKALSNFVQGGVGEVMREKITQLHEEMVESGEVHMLLQVHDQVLFEVPIGEYETLDKIKDVMTFRKFEGMPMPVDVTYGKSWGTLEKWEPRKPLKIKLRKAA